MITKHGVLAVASLWLATSCAARADDGDEKVKKYMLEARALPAPVHKDTEASFTLTITPRSPWVLKTTTPLRVNLTASDGIELEKSKLDAKDIVDPKADAKSIRTAFTAKSPGEQSIAAKLTFFLCTDEICRRYKDSVDCRFPVK
jgi:hypothetical protein